MSGWLLISMFASTLLMEWIASITTPPSLFTPSHFLPNLPISLPLSNSSTSLSLPHISVKSGFNCGSHRCSRPRFYLHTHSNQLDRNPTTSDKSTVDTPPYTSQLTYTIFSMAHLWIQKLSPSNPHSQFTECNQPITTNYPWGVQNACPLCKLIG